MFDEKEQLNRAIEFGIVNDETIKTAVENYQKCYYIIKDVLKKYCDIPEDYYTIISLWILGTYLHKGFNSFPYLYINAIKGAGKTRMLKIIESMAWNGKITNNLSEAVLFRSAAHHTILIDEFEGVGGKDKSTIRELLNSAYKKGSRVERIKKAYTKMGEEHIIEQFEVYTPVVMANIWGMNEVLGDRCIPLIIDKSSDKRVTSLMENFSNEVPIRYVKRSLLVQLVQLCSYFGKKGYLDKWNFYISTLYTNYTNYTNYTKLNLNEKEIELSKNDNFILTSDELALFDLIHSTEINGRDLELFFPLFLVASIIGNDVVLEIINIAKNKIKEKREEELIESRDVCLLDFVSHQECNLQYKNVTELSRNFRMFYQLDDEDNDLKWLNSRWMGRALKRMGLIRDKRRVKQGIEVDLDIGKAKQYLALYQRK